MSSEDLPSVYLPPTLRHKINRIKGFRKNTLNQPSTVSGNFGANSQFRVLLPTRALVDLGSLALRFQVTYSTTEGTVAPPRYVQSFFKKIELLISGRSVALASLNDYGTAYNALANVVFTPQKQQELALFEAGGETANTLVASGTVVQYCMTNWLGLFSGSITKYLPTSILSPTVEIRFTLNDNNVLVLGTASAASYSIGSIFLNTDVVSFDDDEYEKSLLRTWERGVPVKLAFTDFYDFTSTTSAGQINSTFSISTGSLDSIWNVLRATSYDSQGTVNAVSGTAGYYTFVSGADSTHNATYQATINSISYPQFPADYVDVYNSLLKCSTLNVGSHPTYANTLTSLNQYLNGKFCFPIDLEFNERAGNSDMISSGLSTENATVPIVIKVGATNLSGFALTSLVKTTSQLVVFAGEGVVLSP